MKAVCGDFKPNFVPRGGEGVALAKIYAIVGELDQ